MPGADPPPAVTVVVGDEELLVARHVAAVVAAVRALDPAAEVADRTAPEVDDGLALELASPDMFGGHRVLVIRSGHELPAGLVEVLVGYARAPLPELSLVVTSVAGARGRRLVDALTAAGGQLRTARRISRTRERWEFVAEEIRRCGGVSSDGAVRALVDAVGSELRELAQAAAQLVADTGGRVDEPAVARYFRGRADANGFAVADAAVAGNVAEALALLRQALDGGTPAVVVCSALAAALRELARVAAASGGSAADVAKALKLPDWKVERSRRASRAWTDGGLAAALTAVAETDARIKGGGVDDAYSLERAVVAMVAARGHAPRRVR
jgi:DNA polymerase-3 subunit delta